MRKLILAGISVLFILSAYSQDITFDKQAISARLKKDLYFLASDSLQGREAGTKGEIKARDYIVNNYKKIGIDPAFKDGSYVQPFVFKTAFEYGDSNLLKVNDQFFELETDFYPLAYSSNGRISGIPVNVGYGIIVPEEKYDDYKKDIKGKIVVMETSVPEKYAHDSLFSKYFKLQKKVDIAYANGAIGIIFINSNVNASDPSKSLNLRVASVPIPVIFAAKKAGEQIKNNSKSSVEIDVDVKKKIKTAYNVAAFIDNDVRNTIIIGAHYDHIGWGKENSLYTGDVPKIHNGADDNASGTVAVMELARYFKTSAQKNYNYLFINFSAEEEGLLGSSYFTKSNAWNLSKVDYMMNFDMVGRYDTSKTGLELIGAETSPYWDTIINSVSKKDLKITVTKTGLEGSDQVSFYSKEIPILFFFTGLHPDYHRPTDRADKINYNAEAEIICYAEKIIEKTNSIEKLPFEKASDASASKRTSPNVAFGAVADHSFEGPGVKIEDVIDGRPASKAGLRAGDIIIKIGDYDVTEITSYTKALNHNKKGDNVAVTIRRGNDTLVKEVQF
jgi:hypothetical protein